MSSKLLWKPREMTVRIGLSHVSNWRNNLRSKRKRSCICIMISARDSKCSKMPTKTSLLTLKVSIQVCNKGIHSLHWNYRTSKISFSGLPTWMIVTSKSLKKMIMIRLNQIMTVNRIKICHSLILKASTRPTSQWQRALTSHSPIFLISLLLKRRMLSWI